MSRGQAIGLCSKCSKAPELSYLARHAPPVFLVPSIPSSRRSLFTRRSTSFWAHSYPDNQASSSQIPYAPPSPSSATRDHRNGPPLPEEGRKQEKKQRYLDSLMDKAGELNLRCERELADLQDRINKGNWTAQEGRYKKAELCKEYDLDPRDLRKLDSLSPNLVPVILTRRTCILISILHVRALIKPDRVIIFDTAGTVESEVQKRFKWHLERNIKAGLKVSNGEEAVEDGEEIGLAYEHRALESILVATANALEEEMAFTRSLVQQLLADLEDDINRDNLKRLLHYSRRMVGFQSRARYVKRAVDEILDNDEDLSTMYLTSTALGRPRALHDHVQLELLLESFTKQVEEIVSEVDTTVANMQSTQEIAELMLDSGRNALLAMDIKISIMTLGVGTGALVAGVFGMNLTSNLETTPFAFYAATGSAATLALLIWIYGYRVLRRVRRVALSDRSSTRKHIIWEDTQPRFPSIDPLTGQTRTASPWTIIRPPIGIQKPSFWSRLNPFSRSRRQTVVLPQGKVMLAVKTAKGEEPVWINKQADVARARDAWVSKNQVEDEGDIGTGWDPAGWKWGRGKAKWAKE